jgi:predicted acetyltransferase
LAHLEVIRATAEQQPIFENLLELYARDFSEFLTIDLGPDGKFVYRDLPLYWLEPERYPFLAWVDGDLAGFVLVRKVERIHGDDAVWDIAEFFVLRANRRRGIGTELAHAVWAQFPARWQVRVLQTNRVAQQFWTSAIEKFTGELVQPVLIEKDGSLWEVFSFESTIFPRR